jgi:hypothetical protein
MFPNMGINMMTKNGEKIHDYLEYLQYDILLGGSNYGHKKERF